MIGARAAVLASLLAWSTPSPHPPAAAPPCHPVIRSLSPLLGRVDSLVAAEPTGPIAALVGQSGSSIRFLPHDHLVVLTPANGAHAIALPPYLAAPGLAPLGNDARLYMVVDTALLAIDGTSGRLIAHDQLGTQVIGWPAAITSDGNDNLYLIVQPADAWSDQVEALQIDQQGAVRPRWRFSLGLTHAGAWLGLATGRLLAVYTPDQQDLHGTVALLDQATGALAGSYALPGPPIAAAAGADRIYLAAGGIIRAYGLRAGSLITATGGAAPLAVSERLGLVAFTRQGQIVVADAATLAVRHRLAWPADSQPTALAWQGTTLLVGSERGTSRIDLRGCVS